MKDIQLALIGFGNVGRAFARLLLEKAGQLYETYGLRFTITGIATRRHGNIIDPRGIDLKLAFECIASNVLLDGEKEHSHPKTIEEFIDQVPAQVLIETIPVSYQDGKPGVDYMGLAIQRGMHGITANKGTLVHGYSQFRAACQEKGTQFRFESTVMDGIPLFSLFRDTLPAIDVKGFKGVLNATTNLILHLMEGGNTFNQAVEQAQRMGIAETDPSGDIDGWDAAVKVSALVSVLFDKPMTPDQVEKTSIRQITSEYIQKAGQEGKRWKVICEAKNEGDHPQASLRLEAITPDSPFYSIDAANSYIELYTDVMPVIGLTEAGSPGPEATAYGMLSDLIGIYK